MDDIEILETGDSGGENVDLQKDNESPYLDANGKFKRGNPGTPRSTVRPLRTMAAYREAIREAVTPEQLTETIAALWPIAVEQFAEGKPQGFKVLIEHIAGKPPAQRGVDAEQNSYREIMGELSVIRSKNAADM